MADKRVVKVKKAGQEAVPVPWYQQKKWVVSAGLIFGAGLGLVLLEPVVEDIVPVLFSENSSTDDPDLSDPALSDPEVAAPVTSAPEDAPVEGDTESSADDTGESDDAEAEGSGGNEPVGGDYELVIIGTDDISVDDTALKIVSAELNLYPVDKDKLRDALGEEMEQFRGDADAISIRVFYDRREGGLPAFGTWNWAPEGDWSKAKEGDRQTWDDYAWAEPEVAKLESPDSCSPPTETDLELSGAYHSYQADPPSDPDGPTETDPAETEPAETDPAEDEAAPEGQPVEDEQDEAPAGDDEQEDPELADTEVPDPMPPEPEPADPSVVETLAQELGTTAELLEEALDVTTIWSAC